MSDESRAMSGWVTAVCRELGIESFLDADAVVDLVLDLTSDVAHGVSRPAAPITAFLIGLSAGRAPEPVAAAREYARRVGGLAESWGDDNAPGGAAGDQQNRG